MYTMTNRASLACTSVVRGLDIHVANRFQVYYSNRIDELSRWVRPILAVIANVLHNLPSTAVHGMRAPDAIEVV